MCSLKQALILSAIVFLTAACAGGPATLLSPGPSAEFTAAALPPTARSTATAPLATSTRVHLHDTPTLSPPPMSTLPNVTPTAASGTLVIEVGDYYFRPQIATVTAGTTVIWYPVGSVEHTLTPMDPPAPWRGGGVAGAGTAVYKFTFRRPGTYKYTCQDHPAMMDARIYVVESP